MQFTLTVNTETGEQSTAPKAVDLLPTEQVESAAARVRPVFLSKDGVHYEQVLNALNTALKGRADSDGYRDQVSKLRTKFQTADPDYPKSSQGKPWEGGSVSNKELSGAWLYGHLLHEDEKRRSYGHGVPLEETFIAAMRTVRSEMLAVIRTLHLIEALQVKGWLTLPDSVFTDAVTVTASTWTQPGTVELYVADVGTPMPTDPSSDFLGSGDWKPYTEAFPLPDSPQRTNDGDTRRTADPS